MNATQIQTYLEDGYLLLPKLVEEAALTRWSEYFEAIVHGDVTRAPGMVLMKDVMVAKGAVEPTTQLHAINKLLNFEDDETLCQYLVYPDLLDAVRSLIGADLYTLVTNVFNKPPGVDGRHPLHQDLRYFRLRPPELIVASWTAMSRADRESGCMAVVPGSHKQGLKEHRLPDWEFVNFAFYGIDNTSRVRHVHVEMEPGDTLLFHPLLIHGSGTNKSGNFRRAISTHYASARCTSPPPDWRGNDRVRKVARV